MKPTKTRTTTPAPQNAAPQATANPVTNTARRDSPMKPTKTRTTTPAPQNAAPQATANPVTNTAMSFRDFYHQGIALAKLATGEHQAILQAHRWVEPTNLKDQHYVLIELKLEDSIIVENSFETGYQIFINHIKKQLGWENRSISIQEILAHLMNNPFKVWVSYTTINGQEYRNVNYIPPKPVTQEPPADDDADEEVPL